MRSSPEPARSSRGRDLPILWGAQFLNTAALMMLVPVMPFYVERLGVSDPGSVALWSGLALAAPALMLTLTTPLWGWVGDRVGRKWMVVRALVGLAISMGVVASAATPIALVAGRLLQGALGGVVEAAAAFVGGESAEGERGRALGRSYSATASGAVVGPALGGFLIAGDSIRTLMFTTAVLAALAALACAIWLRGRRSGARPDAAPRLRESMLGALREPEMRALFGAGLTAHLAIYGLVPVFALSVRSQLADASSAGAWVGMLHALTWGAAIAGSVWWGRRNDRVSDASESFVLAAALCAGSILLQAVPPTPWVLIPLRIVQGFCFAALAQSVFLHAVRDAPTGAQSAQIGVANSFLLAGQVAGPLLVAVALLVISPSTTIILLALCCAAAAVLPVRAATPRRAASRSPGASPSRSSVAVAGRRTSQG